MTNHGWSPGAGADDLAPEAAVLRALGDPARLRIVTTLLQSRTEVCVCDFVDDLKLAQPTVSHHLKVLRDAGLVEARRRGTWMYYRLTAAWRTRLRTMLNALLAHRAVA